MEEIFVCFCRLINVDCKEKNGLIVLVVSPLLQKLKVFSYSAVFCRSSVIFASELLCDFNQLTFIEACYIRHIVSYNVNVKEGYANRMKFLFYCLFVFI